VSPDLSLAPAPGPRRAGPGGRLRQTAARVLGDALAATASFVAASDLTGSWSAASESTLAVMCSGVVGGVLRVGTLALSRWYRAPRRDLRIEDLGLLARAVAVGSLALAALSWAAAFVGLIVRVSPRLLLVEAVLSLCLLAGSRTLSWSYGPRRRRWTAAGTSVSKRAVFLGAGWAGTRAARDLTARADAGIELIGFVDDDPGKVGTRVMGLPVLGATSELGPILEAHGVELLVVTIASVPFEFLQGVVTRCAELGVEVRIIPNLFELVTGRAPLSTMRPVAVEDLLGRESVEFDRGPLAEVFRGRRLLVTGAGGSIGGEICRHLAEFSPEALVLVDTGETPLFETEQELRSRGHGRILRCYVADVGHAARMQQILGAERPAFVFHAAAYKHVPLMETNPSEALANNLLATCTLAAQAETAGVERFVFVSTDKAVEPASVMGATKRLAEIHLQARARRAATVYVTVRFGNVLGSSGSVVPIFQEQIRHGGPVQVTHPDMTRYFLTIPEATHLLLQAAASGETGRIYMLNMGRPVRIRDLAETMIRLSGLRPAEDVDIVFTGARPGEKIHEDLFGEHERLEPSEWPKIFTVRGLLPPEERVERAIDRLAGLLREAIGDEALRDEILRCASALSHPADAVSGRA